MNELIDILVKQLGLGDAQAKGVLGLLFKVLKKKVATADFDSIRDVLPDVEDLISAAPKAGGLGGMLGGLAGGKVADLAELTSGLKALDLNFDQGRAIVDQLRTFFLAKGKGDLVALVEKLLRA